jgi:hypothetical protein
MFILLSLYQRQLKTSWGSSQQGFREFPYLSEGSLKQAIGNMIAHLHAKYRDKKIDGLG